MKNKNILIALVGLGVLYALYLKNKKGKSNVVTNSEPKNQINFNCEAMWIESSKGRTGSPEFLLKQKNAFLSNCKEGKIDFKRDYGNGLFVTYKNDCNKVTGKCPIVEVRLNGTTWSTTNGKYYKMSGGSANVDVRPIEITEKQWIDEAISKVPF